MDRKEKRTYYFTVEGDTEIWYFQHLKKLLNSRENSKYLVEIIASKKTPKSFLKTPPLPLGHLKVTHVFDRESTNTEHSQKFYMVLNQVAEAAKLRLKTMYQVAYSNFSFELWMILHKTSSSFHCNSREQYLGILNQYYNKSFESLKDYKRENNFKNILKDISLEDVVRAIDHSKQHMQNHGRNYTIKKYKNFSFYDESPSLNIFEYIEAMIKETQF